MTTSQLAGAGMLLCVAVVLCTAMGKDREFRWIVIAFSGGLACIFFLVIGARLLVGDL